MTKTLYTATSKYVEEINHLPVKRQVSVSGILKKLGVSRSGYNAWKKRVPSDTSIRRTVLKEKIKIIKKIIGVSCKKCDFGIYNINKVLLGGVVMTEEEKIFAGKLFDARTKELKDIKHKAHILCQKFNTMDEYDEDRLPIIKEFIGQIGEKYYFQGPIQFNYGTHTFIGENFFSNFNLMVMDDARIYIGDNVMFGPNVSLMATNHPLIAEERIAMKYPDGHVSMSEFADEIHIGNNVWLAANVVVLGGVTIGDNAVIGAGSVVTKDIPANYLAYGVPCKPVREITEEDSKMDLL